MPWEASLLALYSQRLRGLVVTVFEFGSSPEFVGELRAVRGIGGQVF